MGLAAHSGRAGHQVENGGSSGPVPTAFSSAMLIRSAGRFFVAASLRTDSSAIRRARARWYVTPTRPRTSVRCRSAVGPSPATLCALRQLYRATGEVDHHPRVLVRLRPVYASERDFVYAKGFDALRGLEWNRFDPLRLPVA